MQRNKCSCYMNLQDYEKAKEAIVEAEQSDPDSPVIQFYKFKIALAEGQDTIAVDAMTKMSEIGSNYDKIVSETDAHGLLCLAAQQALEQKNHNVAVSALEKVVASSADNQQVLTSLREDHSSFLRYLQTALDHLNQMELVRDSNVLTEAAWFMKIAWNLALESTDCCADMQELFVFCYKTKLLKQCLEYVDASRVLRKKIGIGGLDESLLLLALYEFEAKAQLGDSDLCFCLDAAEALPNADPGTFETFAALAVEPPCHHREISMRALRIAIKKHLAMDVIDFTKLSKAFHSLVHHSLSSGRSSDAESKEEAFTVCQDICEIIENKAKGCYPEIQILWLMTKAWNCGINLFSAGGHEAGEKWCGLAMRLLHHLSTFKCNYQDKMTKVYGDILDRMERNTFKGQVEE
ncbi:Testis-expressed sequence 11 protein [Stylophora pistillata]|uniref:Testis-expressed sequence 11 protein n=1 Tax=Stylophora pistillata TaxID=50429 RepID=A0A2B4RMP8_STYPI|nr:Testis-expressed sequence 11 protein [Stylophora pistillata]